MSETPAPLPPDDDVRRLVDAGLLPVDDGGRLTAAAHRRLQLIQYAQRRGITVDEIVAASEEQGDVLARFEEMVPPNERTYTPAEAAAAAGLPDEFIDELRAVFAFDEIDGVGDDDVEGLRLAAAARSAGMPDDALRQMIRVFLETTERLADAEVRVVHDYIHEPMRVQGLAGPELEAAAYAISGPLQKLIEPTLLYFHRRAWRLAYRDHLLRHIVDRHLPPPAQPGESVATVLFVDLVSFTPLTASMGDAVAADVLRRFAMVVRNAATACSGRIVKQIGDAFMLVFAEPVDAIRFGLSVCTAVAAEPQFPAVHVGAHRGLVLFRDGDYVGTTVNLAARVAAASAPEEFLVTGSLTDAAAAAGAAVHPRGAHELKGVPTPVELHAIIPAAASTTG